MKRLVLLPSRPPVQRGFTIVEIIVIIVVITILATISLVTYHSVQAGANDKAREADVAAIMDALEKYYQKNGEYPADDQLNPTNSPTRLPDFTAVKSVLPTIGDDPLTGPGDYQFYADCLRTGCTNTSDNWKNYMTKSYWYHSRDTAHTGATDSFPRDVAASYGSNTGWGCTVTTYYNDPGYVIAWYSEAKKIWVFKRSAHGKVEIASYGSGPVAPQTCAFS